jgi:hypothetical protein
LVEPVKFLEHLHKLNSHELPRSPGDLAASSIEQLVAPLDSSGPFRLTASSRKKPDLVVKPASACRLVGDYVNHRISEKPEDLIIVQENKKGDDLSQIGEVMSDLRTYEELASKGILLDGKRATGRLVCVAGSYASAQAPYFHDHEEGIMEGYNYYDKIPEFRQFAIGPLMTGALTVTRRLLSGKIGFVYLNPHTHRPYIFVSASEGYDIRPHGGPLDQYLKRTLGSPCHT